MIYAYLSVNYNQPGAVAQEIAKYANGKGLNIDHAVHDDSKNVIPWQHRELGELLKNKMQDGDILIVYEASHFGITTGRVLEVMETTASSNIIVHFVKYNKVFPCDQLMGAKEFLEILYHVESDFIAKRTTEKLLKANNINTQPHSHKKKLIDLEKYDRAIRSYLNINIHKSDIAKILNCELDTLNIYIAEQNINTPQKK